MRNLWLLGLISGMAAVMAASVMPAMGAPVIVALKEGSALTLEPTTGGNPTLNAAFGNGSLATVTTVAVDDTAFSTNPADNYFHGTDTTSGSGYDMLFKFDLSSLPGFIGGTVNVAQLRIYRGGGNAYGSQLTIGRVTTHDWTEALATPANPAGGSTNGWGVASNTRFLTANDVSTPLGSMANPTTTGFLVATVTNDVKAFATGTPNYGWSLNLGNSNNVALSENLTDGNRPVLFLSYTPAPEPATLLLVGLSVVGLIRRRA